jgi:hypothetical protein
MTYHDLFCLVILVILNYFILYFFSNHFVFTYSYLLRKISNIRLISKYFTSFGVMTHCFKSNGYICNYPCYDLSWPILFSYFGYFKLFPFISFSNHFIFTYSYLLRKISNGLISKYFTSFGTMTHCFKTATLQYPWYDLFV